jgi:hypothetical protein
MMKGIIPSMGALITWTIIPGTVVHFLIDYYLSTRGQQSSIESVKDLRRHEISLG